MILGFTTAWALTRAWRKLHWGKQQHGVNESGGMQQCSKHQKSRGETARGRDCGVNSHQWCVADDKCGKHLQVG